MRRLSLSLIALGTAGSLAAVPVGSAAAAEQTYDRPARILEAVDELRGLQTQPRGDVRVRPNGRAITAATLPPQISYSVAAPNGTAVVRIDPRDGQVRTLAAAGETGPDLTTEAWSAELHRVFFTAERERQASSVDSVSEAGGATAREVEAEAGSDVSPDGTRVVFTREEGATTNLFVGTRTPGTQVVTGARRLTGAGGLAPRFSHDGGRIVFSRLLADGRGGAQADLFVIRTDGTGLTRVTGRADADDAIAAFSPDGRRLLFTRLLSNGDDVIDVGVFSVGVDGRGLRLVRSGAAAPDWAENGWLTYLDFAGDRLPQVLVRAPGLTSRDAQLTRETSVITGLRFAR